MTTQNITVGGTGALPAYATGKVTNIVKRVNFATTSYPSGDVLQLVNVPAGAQVLGVTYNVVTADASLTDFSIGDGAGVSRWHANESAASTGIVGSATNKAAGDDADTVDMTLNAGTDSTGVIDVAVTMIDQV